MKPALLIDFGSTYTKVTAADIDGARVIGTAASPTTVREGIDVGFERALARLKQDCGIDSFGVTRACSSAAGGLRMIACGLVPSLTAKAAQIASLGAGAKVEKSFAYKLTPGDLAAIEALRPDILLLTGGTDGGDSDTALHNARALAQVGDFPIVYAGNRVCADEIRDILSEREVFVTENVMPALNELNAAPAQETIRAVFLRRIVEAKGLTRAKALVSGIVMPTPAAMLDAMRLLGTGCEGEAGLGELMAVDLGGATTDVYSIADGTPERANTVIKGLPEPFAKRTVEGDLGMRYGAAGVQREAGIAVIAREAGLTEGRAEERIAALADAPDVLPVDPEWEALDAALAGSAMAAAIERHAGTIERCYTPAGEVYVQTGKDLRSVQRLVLTGGALVHAKDPRAIASYALRREHPFSLKPRNATILLDQNYILAAMGLLSQIDPRAALQIMKKELSEHGAA